MFPSPSGLGTTDLSRDRPPRGSQHPFGSGRSLHPLSPPLQGSLRFFRDPLPARVSTVLADCFVPLPEHPYGLTVFRIGNNEPGGLRHYAGGVYCQRAPTKQRSSPPHPILGQAYQSLWLVRALRRFYSGSLTLVFWPSLAPQPGCDSQYHARPSRDWRTP